MFLSAIELQLPQKQVSSFKLMEDATRSSLAHCGAAGCDYQVDAGGVTAHGKCLLPHPPSSPWIGHSCNPPLLSPPIESPKPSASTGTIPWLYHSGAASEAYSMASGTLAETPGRTLAEMD